MKNASQKYDVVTITLNPAIDLTVSIRNFTPGAVNRVGQSHIMPGGKGVNVASALADHGHRVAATGFLGMENCGDFEALFAEKGIEDCFVRIAGRTRTGIKITDPARHETTDINFPGFNPTAADFEALLARLDAVDGTWATVGGSVPPGIEASVYRDLIPRLKFRGAKVLLDSFGEAMREGIEAGPDIIKPNIHELEELAGAPLATKQAVIEAARTLLATGIGLVAVSMGSKGACFVSETEAMVQRAPEIEIKSTVGAGDAMVAGIVAAQLRGLPLADCARLATEFSVDLLKRNATR